MTVMGKGHLLIGEAYSASPASPELRQLRRMIRSEKLLDMPKFLKLIDTVYDSIKSEENL